MNVNNMENKQLQCMYTGSRKQRLLKVVHILYRNCEQDGSAGINCSTNYYLPGLALRHTEIIVASTKTNPTYPFVLYLQLK